MNAISRIIFNKFKKKATPQEEAALEAWTEEDEENLVLLDRLLDKKWLTDEFRMRMLIDSKRAEEDMMRRIKAFEARKRRKTVLLTAAAVAALVIVGGAIYLHEDVSAYPEESQMAQVAQEKVTDFKHGTSKAIFTDDEGKQIVVTDENLIAGASDVFIDEDKSARIEPRKISLDVPRGNEFHTILEDSTEVWLNSESTLHYPENFGKGERRVAVTGEAYFKVHKDESRPFYVETGGQRIRVYGTTFNVRDYKEDSSVQTTLESGSIAISKLGSTGGEVHLQPGTQAVFDKTNLELKMRKVDPEVICSWRKGRFVFEEQPLDMIMKDLSRWFNFEYEFKSEDLKDIIFMGSIPRYSDFSTAILILENCGDVGFAIEDNKVIISHRK